ncbi:PDDEXK nuclease domain-containing protein [Leptolyngbya sp. DQ-M1]|uniref:PDDEXK nuclease domain-containing protein n=1 Tax=Leptolyngbya sp. DQ-M1 TaxID=2933920 RepID=UPI003298BB47
MEYDRLLAGINYINRFSQIAVARAINQTLTLRNWLIGAYIIEYEQNGVDRAAYGTQLIETLAKDLKKRSISGLAVSNLRNFRQFALAYPHLAEEAILPTLMSFARLTPTEIHQTVSGELRADSTEAESASIEIPLAELLLFSSLCDRAQTEPPLPWQNAEYYQKLFTTLSWSHLLELSRISDRLKRAFYELETVKSNWSLREMKRQMNNMLYERVGLSKDKAAVLTLSQQGQLIDTPRTLIRDPYILEFLGLAERPTYTETDLEQALIDHLQEFMQELGRDFCFVERQFRMTVESEHHFLDLLFYHRALQCLIAIDLKLGKFRHDYAGQMNFYLNYLKENVAYPNENPPVGLILCADRDAETVRYATTGLDNQLFVSRYLIALPSEATLKQWLREEQERLEQMKK